MTDEIELDWAKIFKEDFDKPIFMEGADPHFVISLDLDATMETIGSVSPEAREVIEDTVNVRDHYFGDTHQRLQYSSPLLASLSASSRNNDDYFWTRLFCILYLMRLPKIYAYTMINPLTSGRYLEIIDKLKPNYLSAAQYLKEELPYLSVVNLVRARYSTREIHSMFTWHKLFPHKLKYLNSNLNDIYECVTSNKPSRNTIIAEDSLPSRVALLDLYNKNNNIDRLDSMELTEFIEDVLNYEED